MLHTNRLINTAGPPKRDCKDGNSMSLRLIFALVGRRTPRQPICPGITLDTQSEIPTTEPAKFGSSEWAEPQAELSSEDRAAFQARAGLTGSRPFS